MTIRKSVLAVCIALAMTRSGRSEEGYLTGNTLDSSTIAGSGAVDAEESQDVVGKSRSPKTWLTSPGSSSGASCCQDSCNGGGTNRSGNRCGGCMYGPWCCEGCDCDCLCDDICWDGIGGKYDANYFDRQKLLWVFRPSDTRFLNFVSPITNPVFFEDPRNLTEARVIFLNHHLPSALGGGAVQLLATQVRLALTQRLSLIATKDGYIFPGNSPLPLEGWANVNLGLKYNLYANAMKQQIVSIGTRYELASGGKRNLQGNGDGQFDIFATGGTQLGNYSHFLTAAGFRLPTDINKQNEQFYWSWHLDRRLKQIPLYGLLELNWYHWMSSGTGPLNGIGGLDLYNFGSSGVAGTNIVTGAVGLRYKLSPLNEIGVAWEAPLSRRHDIMDNRITADLIIRY